MLRLELSYRGIVFILLALAGLWTLTELWPVILLVLISLLLMVGLLPFVDAMVRKGVGRGYAVMLLLIALLGFITVMFSVMVPALITESQAAKENLPDSAREIENLVAKLGFNVELQQRAAEFEWSDLLSGRVAVDAGQQLLTATFSIITVIVMTAYLLADTPRMARFIGQFIPEDRKEEGEHLFQSMSRVVGGYLRGQLITSLAIGVFTFVLLTILGVPNPLAFAVFAAFADAIPLVGALAATIPPTAAALQESSTTALIVVVGMIIYQQFEDRLLVPRIYGRMLNLPPIIVLIAVLAGAELLGIIGVLLALPLTAAARVAIDFTIENRRLPLITVEEGAPSEEPSEDDEPPNGDESSDALPSTADQDVTDQILAPDGASADEESTDAREKREAAAEAEAEKSP